MIDRKTPCRGVRSQEAAATDALTLGELLAAGVLAGAMSAVAGGGTFVSLPVLMHAGLSSTVANACSTIGMLPGSLASEAEFGRKSIKPLRNASLLSLVLTSLAGGLAGALLLLVTPSRTFDVILPWLLLSATLALIFARDLDRLRGKDGAGPAALLTAQFLLGVYGGFFGGAVGLMIMAAWLVLEGGEMKRLTPARILTMAAANGMAVIVFLVAGLWRWRETLALMIGGIAGGWLGAALDGRLPDRIVAWLVRAFAALVTAVYFYKAYA